MNSMEYNDEPQTIFSDLTDEEYCYFYDIEMGSYDTDIPFYAEFLQQTDRVLELGCGPGRVTRRLAPLCQSITGIDNSKAMIQEARARSNQDNVTYILDDMTSFSCRMKYDSIIIPYNTLNTLGSRFSIVACLQVCHSLLTREGKLVLHIFQPDEKCFALGSEKFFQFKIFELNNHVKIIKETLRSYELSTYKLILEERYRFRNFQDRAANKDLRHSITLYAPPLDEWLNLLSKTCLHVTGVWSDFTFSPYSEDTTTLLIEAVPKEQ